MTESQKDSIHFLVPANADVFPVVACPLASPQTTFGVRLSRIHFSPTENIQLTAVLLHRFCDFFKTFESSQVEDSGANKKFT